MNQDGKTSHSLPKVGILFFELNHFPWPCWSGECVGDNWIPVLGFLLMLGYFRIDFECIFLLALAGVSWSCGLFWMFSWCWGFSACFYWFLGELLDVFYRLICETDVAGSRHIWVYIHLMVPRWWWVSMNWIGKRVKPLSSMSLWWLNGKHKKKKLLTWKMVCWKFW